MPGSLAVLPDEQGVNGAREGDGLDLSEGISHSLCSKSQGLPGCVRQLQGCTAPISN